MFQQLFRFGARRPPLQRVGILKGLQGKRPPETTVKLWARSNGRIKSYDPFELLYRSGETRPPLQRVGIPWVLQGKRPPETTVKLWARSWSNKKLWPFSAVIPVWRDKTSSSTSRDSISTTWKTASGNYCKTLSAIQRSDQKLWPSSAVIPVWHDKTSSSTSSDSMGTTMKMAFVIYSKTFSAIQRSDQKVIECFNSYSGLARQDLLFNE